MASPPLFIGFILGPIIEKNLSDAIAVHTFVGLLTRPLTVGLTILAVVLSVVFHYLMSKTQQQVASIESAAGDLRLERDPTPSGGAFDANSESALQRVPHQFTSRLPSTSRPIIFMAGRRVLPL